MIIDIHTHIFPDKIAKKTIEYLSEKGGIPPFSDGSVDTLLKKMEEAGTDISINMPVITDPRQFDSVNRYAAQINDAFGNKNRRIISFAGIHPECDDIQKKMAFIKKSGFLGVKLHPDYQGALITHEGYVKIIECAKEYDLVVLTHSGVDAAYRNVLPVKCTPMLAKELIKKVPYSKLVLAHFGAHEMYDGVYELLCGEDVYFDTAYMLRFIDEPTFKKILRRHGDDKILFGSDSPWSDIQKDVEILRAFSLGEETQSKIFCDNAKKLLGI